MRIVRSAKQKLTPMQKAIRELFAIENGSGQATAEQLKSVAEKFDVPVHSLEGLYLDAVDRLADE